MPVKIIKKETPAKVQLTSQILTDTQASEEQVVTAEVIDEYLELDLAIEKHNKKIEDKIKRRDELKGQIIAVVDEVTDAAAATTLMGSGSRGVEISARSAKTDILDLEQAKKFLGTETFWKVAKIGITDLKAYLTKPQFDQVTSTTQTGSRRFKLLG